MAQKVRVVRSKATESVENLLTLAPTPGLKHRIPQLKTPPPIFQLWLQVLILSLHFFNGMIPNAEIAKILTHQYFPTM